MHKNACINAKTYFNKNDSKKANNFWTKLVTYFFYYFSNFLFNNLTGNTIFFFVLKL